MTIVDDDLADKVRIEEPAFYEDPFAVFERMRREAPVFWYAPLDTWVLTTYEDIRFVERTPEIFSNASGITLNDIRYGGVTDSFNVSTRAELLATTDPPRHRELRRVLAPGLIPSSINRWEPTVRAFARRLIDAIVPGEPFNFVDEIGAVLPLQTICAVMGLPGDNIAQLRYWVDERLKLGSDLSEDQLATARANYNGARQYLDEWMVRSLGKSGPELIPMLLNARINEERLSYDNLQTFMRSILGAGNETTRDYISGSMWTYAQEPEQRAVLAADPTFSVNAAEECLRWVTPVRGFVRTVLEDTELHGQAMRRGQHVMMMWMAANRDQDVWDRADVFDITREPRPMHLAFGFGEHACPGAAVARLEHRVFFEELIARYPNWELAGEPVRPNSLIHNSFEELPLVFHR
jgi:cytochrome P450